MFPFIYFPDIFPIMDPGNLGFTIFCCAQCPVKFQNRERGIEFRRSRKIIELVGLGQVKTLSVSSAAARTGQGTMTLSGPNAAARTSQGAESRPYQLPVSTQASHIYRFIGSTKFNPPSGILRCIAHNRRWQMPGNLQYCVHYRGHSVHR